jgi:hypothetical protein
MRETVSTAKVSPTLEAGYTVPRVQGNNQRPHGEDVVRPRATIIRRGGRFLHFVGSRKTGRGGSRSSMKCSPGR